jgi:hypothetical protein
VRRLDVAGGLLLLSAALIAALHVGCGDDEEPIAPGTLDGGDAQSLPTIDTRPVVCDPAVPLPSDLRCTGLYANFDAKTISPDAREFAPALTFWSDGSTKRRWMQLPAGSTIDTTDMDEWVFPVGTKVWKEFTVAGKLAETRLFTKVDASRWDFTTYIWRADATAAIRQDTGEPAFIGTYEVPNTVHCSQCHNGHADRLLGVDAVSLGLPGATGITLASLASEGRLSAPPATTSITLPGDARAQSALGYLHINCGVTCHSPNSRGTSSFTGLLMRLSAKELLAGPVNVTQTDTYKTSIGADGGVPFVTTQYLDDTRFGGFRRITPKDPDKSLVWAVVSLRGEGQMPPIVSHEIDKTGEQLLRDWIAGLP